MQCNSLLKPTAVFLPFRSTARYLGQVGDEGVFIHVDAVAPRIFCERLTTVKAAIDTGTLISVEEREPEAPASVDQNATVKARFQRDQKAFSPYLTADGFAKLLTKSARTKAIAKIARAAGVSGRNARRLLYKFLASGGRQSSLVQRLDRCGVGPRKLSGKSSGPQPLTSRQQRIAVAKTFADQLQKAAQDVASGTKTLDKAWTEAAALCWETIRPNVDADVDLEKVLTARQIGYRAEQIIKERQKITPSRPRSHARAPEDVRPEVGYCFQIDATDSQVDVVSQMDRSVRLGSATGYGVLDVGSTAIVGFSISVRKPSWIASQRALFNAFAEKAPQMARVGIEIPPDLWPCHHYCRVLTSDRGELISEGAEVLSSNFDIVAEFCRSYTPEDKGTLERWFRTLKEDGLEGLDGYGEKFHKIQRGDKARNAKLTALELRKIGYGCVIQHGLEPAPSSAIRPELVSEGLRDVSRFALFKWGLAHAISRPRTGDQRTIYACLLRRVTVTVTPDGLLYKDLRYTSQALRASGLLQRAERSGRFTIEASYDEHLCTLLWFRTDAAAEWFTADLVDHVALEHRASFEEVMLFLSAREAARAQTKVRAHGLAKGLRANSQTIASDAREATPPPRETLPGTTVVVRNAERHLEGLTYAEDALGLADLAKPAKSSDEPVRNSREAQAASLALDLFK